MSSPIDPRKLLECAVAAARAAGNHALQNRTRRKEVVKVLEHDIKLKLDIECQEKAESVIQKTYPDHKIIGEEDSKDNVNLQSSVVDSQDSMYEWIIDPIDGTVNFAHGLPHWCASVAVRFQDQMMAGAVYVSSQN